MKRCLAILVWLVSGGACIAQSNTLVVSEIYGGGGNAGSTYKTDYIQLFNVSASQIDLSGYTLQVNNGSMKVIHLLGTILPFHWFLVKGKVDSNLGADLPTADLVADFNLNMQTGTVALVHSSVSMQESCNSSGENVVDFVGYGNNAPCFELAAAPAQTVDLATSRRNFAADGNNNFTDFTLFPPNPRNGSVIALPVTLHTFSANKNGSSNKIHWQVNCLSTAVTFTVERSLTPGNFISIYTSTETQARCASPFDFKDNNPLNGENYYRLKIEDIDGHGSYSKISLVANSERRRDAIQISPNTVTSTANIHYVADQPGKLQLVVADVAGKIISQMTVDAIAGDNKILLQTNILAKGLYHVILLSGNDKIASSKFIKP